MLAAAVATKLDVVDELGLAFISRRAAGRAAVATIGEFAVVAQGTMRGVAEAHAGVVLGHSLDQLRGAVVEWQQHAADRGHVVGVGVLQQDLCRARGGIGCEGQPPVLVGSGEIDQALSAAPARPPARYRTRERLAHLRLAGQVRE